MYLTPYQSSLHPSRESSHHHHHHRAIQAPLDINHLWACQGKYHLLFSQYLLNMRLPFRKKDKKRDGPSSPVPAEFRSIAALDSLRSPPSQLSARILAQLPDEVLQRIFISVCPQALDKSYESCEESANDEGCMLCDVRDLSHCTQVNKKWRRVALQVLYVYIQAVWF